MERTRPLKKHTDSKAFKLRIDYRTALNVFTWLAVTSWSSACPGDSRADAKADPLPESLRTCASIKRSSERLACYDRAVELLSSGAADGTTTFEPSPEAMFGTVASDPRPATTAASPEREELSAVTARVTGLKRDGEGMNVIELSNGQAWRQISG